MIARPAVEAFVNKKLDDWSWAKDLSKKDMIEELQHIAPKFRFKTEPWEHQLACFILGMYNPQFLFFLDMGLGKSKLVLDLITYYNKYLNKIRRTLVLVPGPVNIYGFADEVKVHSKLSCVELYGLKHERWSILKKTKADLYILNYAGLHSMIMEERTKDGQGDRLPDRASLNAFTSQFDSVIFDEIHKAKNHKTLTYRLCSMISRDYRVRYGLTGTPMGRDTMDLWSEFCLIDNGDTLGKNITLYREGFYKTRINYWGGYEFTLDPEKEVALQKRLLNKSIRYDESEVEELPGRVDRKVKIKMPAEARGYYNSVVKGLVLVKGDYRQIKGVFVRLRQICSGFFQHKLDEIEDKVLVDFEYNPKLEATMMLLDTVPGDSKIVIFHEFIHSGDLLAKELKKNKYKYIRLYGATKDKKGVLDTFLNDKKCRVFLVNSESGGTGLNLQSVANYVIYYECPISSITRRQTEKRVYRPGQTKRTFIYDLVIESSVEEKILEFMKEGKDIFRAVIDGKVKL
jgi:SNF2 family DNA or RNA helicase